MERRDFFRLPVSLKGSCTLEDNDAYPCETVDLSYRGARVMTVLQGRIGAKASLDLPEIGTLSGRIIRVLRDGFALEFDQQACSDEMSAVNAFMLNHRPSKKRRAKHRMAAASGEARG